MKDTYIQHLVYTMIGEIYAKLDRVRYDFEAKEYAEIESAICAAQGMAEAAYILGEELKCTEHKELGELLADTCYEEAQATSASFLRTLKELNYAS